MNPSALQANKYGEAGGTAPIRQRVTENEQNEIATNLKEAH